MVMEVTSRADAGPLTQHLGNKYHQILDSEKIKPFLVSPELQKCFKASMCMQTHRNGIFFSTPRSIFFSSFKSYDEPTVLKIEKPEKSATFSYSTFFDVIPESINI